MIMKRFWVYLIIFLCLGMSRVDSSSYRGIEITRFCRDYGYQYKIRLHESEILLRKGNFEVRFITDSKIAITNSNKIWYLDTPIQTRNQLIILPPSLIRKLLQQNTRQKIQENIPNEDQSEKIYPIKSRSRDRIQFIVLDPGHGGRDPGNIHNKIIEKKINLQVTRKVIYLLRKKMPWLRIYNTRSGDQYVTLEDRSIKAINLTRLNHQGIFVSIHSNASLNPEIKGIETFFYASGNANKSQLRISCVSRMIRPLTYDNTAGKIISKLYDLQISKESKLLADAVHKNLFRNINRYTNNRGVKAHTPYFVITHNNLPSILVEIGFLTHKNEARNLSKSHYQDKIAHGIAEGIHRFIVKYNQNRGFIDR